MTIKEAEALSGVSSRNIRFYEKKGLLKPQRNRENDYRVYSEEDIERLKLIRMLRMVDMPLEQILDITQGRLSLQSAAAMQMEKLEEQIKHLKTALQFCEELSESSEVNVSEVLQRMDEPMSKRFLFRNWTWDFAEFGSNFLRPLAMGLLPFAFGLPQLFLFYLFNISGNTLAMLLSAFVLPCVWVLVGYRYDKRGKWLSGFFLTQVIPIIVVALALVPEILPHVVTDDYGEFVTVYLTLPYISALLYPLALMNRDLISVGAIWTYICGYAVIPVCLFLGKVIGWIMPWIRKKQEECLEKRMAKGYIPGEHSQWKKTLIIIGICIAVTAVLSWPIYAPLEVSARPEHMWDQIAQQELYIVMDEQSYFFTAEADMEALFQFEAWERVYCIPGISHRHEEVCKIRGHRGMVTYMTLYDDGCARTFGSNEHRFRMDSGYFEIPEEAVEALVAYLRENAP